MNKAWFVLVVASCLLLLSTYLIPENLIAFSKPDEFEQLLTEQMQDSAAYDKTFEQAATIDTTLQYQQKIDALNIQKRKQDSLNKVTAYKNTNREGLSHFFEKLEQLETQKKGRVRIAFFGDSMEDGDMIVMQLRHYLQRRFGGKGVGFVPITSAGARGRYSIKHEFTHNWNKSNFLKKGYGRFQFGLNGKTFYVGDSLRNDKAVVRFTKGTAYKELPLINPTLFYGKSLKDSTNIKAKLKVVYSTPDTVDSLRLLPQKLLNTQKLPNLKKEFTLTIYDQQTTPFYGVSFASDNGVVVDNLSVRGNSGLPLIKLDYDLMRKFDKELKYDLVVLAYGTNVFSFKNEKYNWYQHRMLRIVKYMQKCYRNANVLIVSMGDRSTKIDGVMQTPSQLPNFIALQYNIAKKSKAGFYSLYDAMGGANSMVRWVEQDSLANKDYTHFNSKGSVKAGRMMYNWLMKNYNQYKKQNR